MFVFTRWGCDKKWMMNLYSNTPLIIPTGFQSKVTATGAHATNIWQIQVDWVQYFFIYLFFGGGRGWGWGAVDVLRKLCSLRNYYRISLFAAVLVCLSACLQAKLLKKVMNDCHEIFWRGPQPRPRRSALFFSRVVALFSFFVVGGGDLFFFFFFFLLCVCVCVWGGGGGGGLWTLFLPT